MKEITLNQALAGIFLILGFALLFTLKIGGSTEISSDVEKNGYCKIVYGDEWKYDREKDNCWSYGKEKETFTEDEFRELCPENQFISTKFYSSCFHKGDAL